VRPPLSPERFPLGELALKARQGDGAAEERLFEDLREAFLALAVRRVESSEVAEDLAHDALVVVKEKLSVWDPSRGFEPWALAILRNIVGNYYRKAERRRRLHPGPPEPSPAADVEARDRAEVLRTALAELSPQCRRLMHLLLEGRTPREAAAAMGITNLSAFYLRSHRCRQTLRKLLRQYGL
jgi:RNA polymerase sigma factor (sigma-70 family)